MQSNDSKIRVQLAWANVGLVAFLFVMLALGVLPISMKDIILIMVGQVMGQYNYIHGYFFGSSSGSKKKDAIIAGTANDADEPNTTQ